MTAQRSTIKRTPRDGELPLSYAQQRLWFLQELEPNSPSYNRPTAIRLSGSLNVIALERSFGEIVSRHEILRTTFPVIDGNPVQFIAGPLHPKVAKVNLETLPENQREAEARRLLTEEARRSFDLARGPLLRAMLVRLGREEHILLLTTHHIVFDAWSEGVLLRELGEFYNALSTGSPCALSDLPIQYADFVVWQHQSLAGEALEKQLDYWKRTLMDAAQVLDLPTDKPRPSIQSFRGRRQSLQLSKTVSGTLGAFSRREGVTLFTTLLAGFQTLLHRYTGQTDIVVGTPIAGRTRIELEGLIGLFVNTLVVRTDLSEDPSFRVLLARVWKAVLGSWAHQDLPFEKLVEVLAPKRSTSHTPLFQVVFQLRNVPRQSLDLLGLKADDFGFDIGIAKFDLAVEMVETSQGLSALFEYNDDLFDDSTIARMLGHFETLLESIVLDPEQHLSALPILSDTERHQLLVAWNHTRADYSVDACIHSLFEAQAERTPEASAVVFGNQRLTYEELNRRANRLAHHLQNLGVGPEVLVGICVERSVEMLVGLLGTLKAGGAYVPLDPASPRERLSFMLEDARVAVLLTQEPLLERLPKPRAGVITVCLDSHWEAVKVETNLPSRTAPENLAYVIYTSGSTGQPKGVGVRHAGLVNLVRWHQQEYQVATQHATQLASPAFDACQWELWPYLLAGASVHIPDEETRNSPSKLVEWLTNEAIEICFLPTPLAVEALQLQWPSRGHLKALLTGGDVLPPGSWRDVPFSFRLFNYYGPTETTVVATSTPIETGLRSDRPPPIGRPIANTQVYLVDSHLQMVPIGVPGELCIGGASLARSYFNRPELTAEKFIPHPFSGVRGSRLYRSGDLARYLPNGDIEFLGRIDHQVKIRGFRIELGEIEAALRQHPGIREAVVLAREDAPGEKYLVGYLVPIDTAVPKFSELRAFLKKNLPDYMVPSAYVTLTVLPLTPNGKLDRRALPAPQGLHPELEAAYVKPTNEVERSIAGLWQEILKLERVGIDDNFFDLGGHSLLLVQLRDRLKRMFDREVSFIEMFEYPTVSALARFLSQDNNRHTTSLGNDEEAEPIAESKALVQPPDIAIIGMACRFPGAKSVDEFWHNLSNGVESITSFSDEELKASGVDPELLNHPEYVRSGALLDGIELFDATFFGFNAREAEITDPQHRLLLECAWEAFENAGYDAERYNGLVGVFTGASVNSYLSHHYTNPSLRGSPEGYKLVIGNDKDFVATRVSYKLGFRGPSVNVQTACSTSLVAVHLASQSLLNGECDMALAGAVSIYMSQKVGYLFQEGMIYSPDGHCRAFDEKARGTIGGNGLGIVVLKRLADALTDGDTIHAVIKGSSVNNDGALKVGYTAPSVSGQADVIKAALMKAGVFAETIGYVEAHGTGTELGDPIEIAALTKAFRATTNRAGFCGIGSVKTNIGHLNTAAGIAGLIKTVLALKNRRLPQSLHFERPNPKIDFEHSPFHVITKLAEWEAGPTPRRAGVSSFGIGGTNAHVVLEEAPAVRASEPSRPRQLLLLSAKTKTALESSTLQLTQHLKTHSDLNLADVAYTLKLGRKAFKHRCMLVCRDTQDALSVLENQESDRLFTSTVEAERGSVVFMFTGQGSQYVNMALELYRVESKFRKQVDTCSEFLRAHLGFDLREVLFPGEEHLQKATDQISRTATTQPALFVIEYALAKTLMDWGVVPEAVIGHSLGEYVAACLAGVFSLEDALTLVAERGQLMNELPRGAMLAVPLTEEEVHPLLGDELSVSAVNTPSSCVVSGPTAPIDQLEKELKRKGLETVRLLTSHAFHSSMMDPVLKRFTARVRNVKLSPPRIPCLSNLTGTWMTPIQATDPEYWARQLRQTVRFSEGLRQLAETQGRVFLEIGPGRTLSVLAKQHTDEAAGQFTLSSLRHHKEESKSDLEFLLRTLGQLWLAGISVDWTEFYAGERRNRIPLPTYPFERERYWVEPQRSFNGDSRAPISFKKPDISDWFYIPSWKRSPLPRLLNHEHAGQELPWLIFDDGIGLGSQIAQKLKQLGFVFTMVRVGEQFSRVSQDLYLMNPRASGDCMALFEELQGSGRIPGKIMHLWSVTPSGQEPDQLETSQDLGLFSLLHLVQAIGELSLTCPFSVAVISNNLQEVTGEENLCPAKATVLGPCKIIPSEYPNIVCRSIDVVVRPETGIEPELIDHLLTELSGESADSIIAYRGKHRWVQTFEPIRLERSSISRSRLREKGVYLITGGLGGIGMALTEHLAKTLQARLVLTGRSDFPARQDWERWLSGHGAQDAVSLKIQKLKSLEALGAEILVFNADVSNLDEMQKVVAQTKERFERINGVLHCAGIADQAGVIQRRSREMSDEILASKVRGTVVLDTVLRGSDLDFLVLCSSLSSVLYHSKFGQVAYNAANEFLDAFAFYKTRKDGTFAVTINWTDWQEAGMSVEAVKRWIKTHGFSDDPSILGSALLPSANIRDSMLSSEGVEVFERVLANPFARVVVSTHDLGAMIKEDSASITPAFLKIAEEITRSQPKHRRPQLTSSFVAPRGKVGQAIAKIWQELIGFDQLGIHDNFFELGGDSLLATRVMSRLRSQFQLEISLKGFFDHPTVASIASMIAKGQVENDKEATRILEKVESLSDEEAHSLLLRNLKRSDA